MTMSNKTLQISDYKSRLEFDVKIRFQFIFLWEFLEASKYQHTKIEKTSLGDHDTFPWADMVHVSIAQSLDNHNQHITDDLWDRT